MADLLLGMPYTKKFDETLYNADWLRREYVENKRNAAHIALELGCTNGAVLDGLHRYGIEVRSYSETQLLRTDKSKGSHAPRPRAKFMATLSNPDWLQEQYVKLRRPLTELSAEIGCSAPALVSALRRVGITTRTISEAVTGRPRPGRRKPSDLLTHGGQSARARRACPTAPCAVCSGDGVDVNHKDKDRTNSDLSNLERLCVKCHSRQHVRENAILIRDFFARGGKWIDIHTRAREEILAERASATGVNST